MRRRTLLVGGAQLAAALAMVGCGSNTDGDFFWGGANVGPSTQISLPPGAKAITGKVNTGEIGGSPWLAQSFYAPGTIVAGDGTFLTAISKLGPQLLALTQGNNLICALAIVINGDSLTFDAQSTALAAVFATPGILDTDPVQAPQVLQRILGLASFTPFLNWLRQRLPSTPWSTLGMDAQYLSLRDAVVQDYLAAVKPRTINTPVRLLFDVTKDQQQNYALANREWRFLNVIRQELDANGNEIRHQIVHLTGASNPTGYPNIISGANAISWGNLFTGQIGSAGQATDTNGVDPNTKKLVYWVHGPGRAVDSVALPDTFNEASFGSGAVLATLIMYGFFPFFDLVTGAAGLVGAGASHLQELMASFVGIATQEAAFLSALRSGDRKNILNGFIDVYGALLGATEPLKKLLPAALTITVSAEAAAVASLVLGTTGLVAAAYNLSLATTYYLTCPETAKAEYDLTALRYTVTETDAQPPSIPLEINRFGHFPHIRVSDLGGGSAGFELLLYKDGTNQPIAQTTTTVGPNGSLGVSLSGFTAINDADDIAYTRIHVDTANNYDSKLWRAGITSDLPGDNFTLVYALNNRPDIQGHGQVAGISGANIISPGYLWQNGVQSPVVITGWVRAMKINDSGEIAAVRQPVVNSPVYEVVVKDGSTLTVLDSLDINKVGSAVNFIALNSHGLIGYNQEWGSGLRAMVVSTSEASRPLPVPDTVAGAPVVSYSMVGLNDDGLALGLLENNQGVAVAVVWEANGAMNLLQDLVPPGSPSLDSPLAIGNGGHILAVDSSTSKVYLLTPA